MPDISETKSKPAGAEFQKSIRTWRPPSDDEEPLIPIGPSNPSSQNFNPDYNPDQKSTLKNTQSGSQSGLNPIPNPDKKSKLNKPILHKDNNKIDIKNQSQSGLNPIPNPDYNPDQKSTLKNTRSGSQSGLKEKIDKKIHSITSNPDCDPDRTTSNRHYQSGSQSGLKSQNEEQSSNKQPLLLSSFSGLKFDILRFLYLSKKVSGHAYKSRYSEMCKPLQTTAETIRKQVKQLSDIGAVKRKSEQGAGGWIQLLLNSDLEKEFALSEAYGLINLSSSAINPDYNPDQTKYKHLLLSGLQSGLSDSSSSGINISPTTTSAIPIPDKKELPQEWKEINYSCLASIGFRECHLRQIFDSGKVSPEMVQESIYEIDHDLKSGNHGMRSPLLVLLKQLRGKGEPYTAITPGYVSDQIKYERKQLEELERRNRELIEIVQKQESLKNLPGELEKESRFQAWCKSLPPEQKKAIAPRATIEGSEMQLGLLRAHWETKINGSTN
jgi:hypothetical protein